MTESPEKEEISKDTIKKIIKTLTKTEIEEEAKTEVEDAASVKIQTTNISSSCRIVLTSQVLQTSSCPGSSCRSRSWP